jgi:hypothetical protein
MRITQIDLNNKRQVEDFLRLPFSIYRDIPQWVPPLQMDERIRLNPKRFPFYKHSLAAFFIAYERSERSSPVDEEERAIGRLAILDNRPHNEFNNETTGFFPFGWLTVLRELKRADWLDINGAGLIPEYRGSGGMAILYSEMFKSVKESGRFRHAAVVQIGVENEPMQRDFENFGVDFYKTHRTYQRSI